MSLQVWLPLNGNLNNYGLSNSIAINSGSTVDNSGKIGKCYSFDGIDDGITILGLDLSERSELSVALWVYPLTTTLKNILSFERDTYWQFSFYDNYISIRDNGVGYTGDRKNIPLGSFEANKWIHIAVTYNKGTVKIYRNGELFSTSTTSGTTLNSGINNYVIGRAYQGGTYFANDKINDIRIYDHCLSDKEIKEVSKGLVLHYPLSSGYIESTTNLIGGPTYLFDTCYNGSTGKYGFGAETDIYQIIGNFNGKQCTKVYMGTDGLSAYPYPHFDLTKSTPAINGYKTISFDYYPTKIDSLVFYSHGTSCTFSWKLNNNAIGTTGTISGILIKLWNHIEMTIYNNGTTTGGCGYVRIGTSSHTSTTADYWLFANMLIEEKDHATPYTSSSRLNNVIQDSSGYSNDGIINGTISINGIISPRYLKCADIPVSTTITHNRAVAGDDTLEWTCCAWIYMRNYSSSTFLNNFNSGNRLCHSSSPLLYLNSGSYDYYIYGNALETNTWIHIAFVFRNSDHLRKIYRNGIDISTQGPLSNHPSGISNIVTLLSNFDGYISDYREYATALSAEDIKELYEVSLSVDKNGNVYAYEFIEE